MNIVERNGSFYSRIVCEIFRKFFEDILEFVGFIFSEGFLFVFDFFLRYVLYFEVYYS